MGGFLFTFIQSKVCAGEEVSDGGERQTSWWLAWRGDKELLYVAIWETNACYTPSLRFRVTEYARLFEAHSLFSPPMKLRCELSANPDGGLGPWATTVRKWREKKSPYSRLLQPLCPRAHKQVISAPTSAPSAGHHQTVLGDPETSDARPEGPQNCRSQESPQSLQGTR